MSSCGSSSERCPVLGPSQLHSSERASRPAARTAHRAQQPGEIRWDGSKKAELAGGLVLAWCRPGIIIHNHISWRLSIGRARPGGHMRGGGWHTQTIIAAAATKFQTSWLMIKCWKQCSQCSSLHSDRVLSMGNIFRVIMLALNFKIVGDHNNYTVVEVVKYLKGESPYL